MQSERRGRRLARRAADGRPRDHVHGLPGTPADAPRHVQDRRRAHALRDARRRSHRRDACALDLRRSQRRNGGEDDRVRDAVLVIGPEAQDLALVARATLKTRVSRSSISSTASDLARGREDPPALGRGPRLDGRSRGGARASTTRPLAGAPGPSRERAEPGRLLPGPGGGESVPPRRYRTPCSSRWTRWPAWDRTALSAVRLRETHPEAEHVVVAMGSACGAASEAVALWSRAGSGSDS